MHRLGRISGFVSTLSVLIVIALCCVATACGAGTEPTTITNYTSKSQALEFGYRSQWKQPWRSYMETVPATTFLNAIGINFNVPSGSAAPTAKLLGESGFKRARIEVGWGNLEYASPTKLKPSYAQNLRTTLLALKENGIRPLILLNSNSGEPCPVLSGTVTLSSAVAAGATELHISPADVGKVIAGRTGISESGVAAQTLFKSVAADGTVKLSRPLGKSLKAGTLQITTLRYEPFRAEKLTDGEPNPAIEETLRGWTTYVAAVTQEVKAILGSDQFDVEVWNELTFGSQFLSVENYYSPGIEGGRWGNEETILDQTIRYIRDPANGLSDVGIGDGFSNERPWEAGSTSPVGLTAIDKHPYKGLVSYPQGEANGNIPLNALGQRAAAIESNGEWRETWAPNYDAFFPEYYLSGIQTETLVHDLSPSPSNVQGVEHGRFTHPEGGAAPQVWVTEVGLEPEGGPAENLSAADVEHINAKDTLRYLTSYINKGVTNLDLYAADGGNFSIISPSFFNALKSSPSQYPGSSLGGETTTAVRRMVATMQGAQTVASPRSLSLQSLTDYSNNVQFDGNGTAQGPSLYNREVFAFLPFQVTDDHFVIPVYVMTRNVEQAYKSGTEPSRFDLPQERYKMVIGGVHGESVTATATDPLSGETVPVEIVARGANSVTVEMEVTDSPRMLSIKDGGGPVEGTPSEEEPTEEEPALPEEVDPETPVRPEGPPGGSSDPHAGAVDRNEAPAPTPVASDDEAEPEEATVTTPTVRLSGGHTVLKNGRLQVVAKCRTRCKMRASGAVHVHGHSYRLTSYPHGPVASPGGRLTIQLRLTRGATEAARSAARRGSEIEAVATVLADDGARQTVAAQIN